MDQYARIARQGLFLLVAMSFLANGGCMLAAAGAAAGGGAAAYAYYQGKVCRSYAANFNDVWAAARTALTELGMPIALEEREADHGCFHSRTADGEKVRVSLEVLPARIPADPSLTQVCVRVATFGDHQVSDRILDQVGYHLIPYQMARPAPVALPTTAEPPRVVPVSQTTAPPPLPPEPLPQR